MHKSVPLHRPMERKYFAFDKNYLLKEAQWSSKESLIPKFLEAVKEGYQIHFNPLGLMDGTVEQIMNYHETDIDILGPFYEDVAGIYRYKFGEVQLEFLWDGSSHQQKYRDEWERTLLSWAKDFSSHPVFIRAIFDLTVFKTPFVRPELVHQRLRNFLVNFFNLKIYHYKGIVTRDVA